MDDNKLSALNSVLLRCSSVTYLCRYAPSSRLTGPKFFLKFCHHHFLDSLLEQISDLLDVQLDLCYQLSKGIEFNHFAQFHLGSDL